jgi:hypothetical protein
LGAQKEPIAVLPNFHPLILEVRYSAKNSNKRAKTRKNPTVGLPSLWCGFIFQWFFLKSTWSAVSVPLKMDKGKPLT